MTNFIPHTGTTKPSLDPRLWEVRAVGADAMWAEEVAKRLGPRAVIIQTGDHTFSVFEPKFDEVKIDPVHGDHFRFIPDQLDDEWVIRMEFELDGVEGTQATLLSRDDISRLLTQALPEAAALLDTLRHTPAQARLHGRRHQHRAGHDRLQGNN